MADNGFPDVMGSQARDRPPNKVIDRPNWDIAQGAAIARYHPNDPALAKACVPSRSIGTGTQDGGPGNR